MNRFSIAISSPPDRERLVAEIFFEQEQVAELNTEHGPIAIELYPRQGGGPWRFDAEDFLSSLLKAKASLLGEPLE
jgi:hypothetical protein